MALNGLAQRLAERLDAIDARVHLLSLCLNHFKVNTTDRPVLLAHPMSPEQLERDVGSVSDVIARQLLHCDRLGLKRYRFLRAPTQYYSLSLEGWPLCRLSVLTEWTALF